MDIAESIEKQIHSQMDIIRMQGGEPSCIRLTPSAMKVMETHWKSQMNLDKDLDVSIQNYMGIPLGFMDENLSYGGIFAGGKAGHFPPVVVTSDRPC